MTHTTAVKAGLVLLAITLAAASVAIRANSLSTTVRIIYTNDTTGYFEPCG